MKLENVLKVMAAVTAMLVALSEVLNQANQYNTSRKGEDNSEKPALETATSSVA